MSQGTLTSSLLFAVVPALFAAGCVEMEDEGLSDEDLGTEAAEIGFGCGSWGCDMNSPVIDAWDFHELEESGIPNDKGVRVLGLVQGSNLYRINVHGAKIYGMSSSGVAVSGAGLVNSYIWVNTPGGNYRIYIKAVSTVTKFWVGNPDPIETYDLVYTKQTAMTDLRPLCKNAPGRLDGEGQFWLKPLEAIVFAGDRYNSDSLEVTATGLAAGNWFNIGCAGSALAKLHLNRHTQAGSDSTHFTTKEMRQAMLKMYTADVCGSGDASTEQGEPLHWENKYAWQKLTGTESSIEALWNEDGAICLEEHRLKNDPVLWPQMWPGIQSACASVSKPVPQPCSVVFPGGVKPLPGSSYLLTANP